MPRRARPILEPDLFSIETVPRTPTPPATPPALMPAAGSLEISPEDFRRMMARWSDDEVERLRAVVAAEARRRGLLPPRWTTPTNGRHAGGGRPGPLREQ
jgi:hypothetical protein